MTEMYQWKNNRIWLTGCIRILGSWFVENEGQAYPFYDVSIGQWFPTFFISRHIWKYDISSRPHLKKWHSRSVPAINCNIKVFK